MNLSLSDYLSVAAIVIVLGYIAYNEQAHHTPKTQMSDEGTMTPVLVEAFDQPLPAVSFDLPKGITFADELVPLDITDVHERLDKELQINSYYHSNTIFLMKRANRWLPQMEAILKKNGIPDDFKYLPLIESNLLNVTSPRDAVGYWQILKTSGKEYGLEITSEVDERYDPLKATEAACRYLKQAYRKFNNWTLAAASYNRGMTGMQNAIDNQRVDHYYDLYLNDETSRYVFRLLAIKEIIEHPVHYGFKIKKEHLYPEIPLRFVEVDESIKDLVDFAKDHDTNYKLIKTHNPWLRDDRLTVKKGRRYRIAIPAS